MKLNKVLFSVLLAASVNALAANPAPVFNVSTANNLAEQLATLDRKLDARNKAQVSIQQQLDALQNEVSELRGVTELHSHQLSQVLERQRELYQELDRRVAEALKPSPSVVPAMPVTVTSNNQTPYSNNLNENELYDRAVNLVLKDKQYEQAITEFSQFNKLYPQSSYAANAHYWLGQLLFNKGELASAKKEFLVVEQFKDSAKRGDALLKLALVAQKENNQQRAIALYQQVIAEYPDSSSAQLAQARLDSQQ
jgi:tol-pal system protein YbgF